jgi:hypothetical protein
LVGVPVDLHRESDNVAYGIASHLHAIPALLSPLGHTLS